MFAADQHPRGAFGCLPPGENGEMRTYRESLRVSRQAEGVHIDGEAGENSGFA